MKPVKEILVNLISALIEELLTLLINWLNL